MDTFHPDKSAYPMDARVVERPRRSVLQQQARDKGVKITGHEPADELVEMIAAAPAKAPKAAPKAKTKAKAKPKGNAK